MNCYSEDKWKSVVDDEATLLEPESPIAIHLEECEQCSGIVDRLLSEGSLKQQLLEVMRITRGSSSHNSSLNAIDTSHENLKVLSHVGADSIVDDAVLFGHFILLEKLGAGGMGEVWKAINTRANNRSVALKRILNHAHHDLEFVNRFRREASTLLRLHHHNLMEVFDSGSINGTPYIEMGFIKGQDLQKRLSTGGCLSVDLACRYVEQAARGLHEAHELGIVHRDVKPSNLMLYDDQTIKVVDFGLVKWMESTDATELTQTQTTLGTREYLSPEQQDNSSRVDRRSDIYSLGVTLYRLLTNTYPIGNYQSGSDFCALPSALRVLLNEMLAVDPKKRPQSALELANRLAVIEKNAYETTVGQVTDAHESNTDLDPSSIQLHSANSSTTIHETTKIRKPSIVLWGVTLICLCIVIALVTRQLVFKPAPTITPIPATVVEQAMPDPLLAVGRLRISTDVEGVDVDIMKGKELIRRVKLAREQEIQLPPDDYDLRLADSTRLRLSKSGVSTKFQRVDLVHIFRKTPDEEDVGFESLFDGASFTGFIRDGSPTDWFIANGELISCDECAGTHLFTEREFENFDFRCEFNLSEMQEGGILLISELDDSALIDSVSMSFACYGDRMAPSYVGGVYWKQLSVDPTKRHLPASPISFLRPESFWNDLRVRVNHGTVESWINGHLADSVIVDVANPESRVRSLRGRIGLRGRSPGVHPGTIRFRNLRVRELPPNDENKNHKNSSKTVTFDANRRFELLKYLRESRRVPRGWKFTNEGIVSEGGRCTVEVPAIPEGSYRLRAQLTRLEDNGSIVVGLRAQDGHRFIAQLGLVYEGQVFNRLEFLDGVYNHADTTVIRPTFKAGEQSELVCTVQSDEVRIEIDGKELIRWKGDHARLTFPEFWSTLNKDRLFITSNQSPVLITKFEVEQME